jgi:hypothetical protein
VGGGGGDDGSPTLDRLKARLGLLEPASAIVVFTGNYGVGGLPAPEAAGRAEAERRVLVHVTATVDFVKRGGRVFFLAGHRDFAGGVAAVRRLRELLNRSFEKAVGDAETEDRDDLDVMPQASCGDTTLVEIDPNLGLLLVNSEWWMQDWASDPQANEGCEVKSRKAFSEHLQNSLNSYRGRRLVIASHHPLRSYGPFGGSFTAKAHLRPAPILGTAWVFARQAGLVPEYQNAPIVRSYLDLMFEAAQRNGSYVFASGHDADLQYLHIGQQVQLVSGTSARLAEPTVRASEGDFAAGSPGWAEVTLDPSGAGEVSFFSGDAGGEAVFRAPLPAVVPRGGPAAQAIPPFPKGQVRSTYTKRPVWKMSAPAKLLLGSFYSGAYTLELPYETLDLATEQGGLTPRGTGGGLQTNGLKLRDPQGGDWVIRSVTKDSSRVLPWPQNQATVINRLLDHGYTATHPEGALAVPRLSVAVGVLHAEPRLLYLPDQEGLLQYRGFISNEVVLLERRPKAPKEGLLPESLAGPPGDQGTTKFKSTQETIDKTIDKPARHRVDQEAMLRARLLDLFLGDWDRHHGQWSFAVTRTADGTRIYRPVAKDRDQAFANYDGLGLFLARIVTPDVRVLQPFSRRYGNLEWLNFNARNIDRLLLNGIPHARWLEIARAAKDALTNGVIDEAFATWHREAYALDGARIVAALKIRRDHLVEAADGYFRVINRHADVLGSSHDDAFDLWFEGGGSVRVTIRGKAEGGETEPVFFDRVYLPGETASLNLYGLEGDDGLVVHGASAATSIDIRFVGGAGNDTVAAAVAPGGEPLDARAICLYDSYGDGTAGGATIDPSIVVDDRRSEIARLNQYDQNENHDPDFGTFIPRLIINPEYGLYLGGKYSWTAQGFKKHPFAARHEFGGAFATSTLGAAMDYRGLFPQDEDGFEAQVDLRFNTPTYTRNFYGLTNRYVADMPADFYRLRQALFEGRLGLNRSFPASGGRLGIQLFGQAFVTENTPGRLVNVSPDVTPDAFGPRGFLGAKVFAEVNTFDDPVLPTRGIALHGSAEGRLALARPIQGSVTLVAAGALAIPFDRQRRLVLISRARLEGIVGDHPFYLAPTLGGTDLRAYHFQQLAGDAAFSHTTDLRLDVFRIYSWLPGTIGVNLSIDHGRVFGPSTREDDYHLDLGGGLWWSILDLIGVSASYYHGLDDSSRFVVAVGPLFSATGY